MHKKWVILDIRMRHTELLAGTDFVIIELTGCEFSIISTSDESFELISFWELKTEL